MMKKKEPTQDNPGASRELTTDDHKKIQRLLETAEAGNVRLALELTEEICNEAELDEIITDENILSLVSSGDVEVFALASSFFLRHREHWDRFLQCATNTRVLTGTAMLNRTADLSDFTAITVEAADLLGEEWSFIELNGLSNISLEVAQQLAKSTVGLELNGLATLSDEVAVALAKHKGERLELNGLISLSDAAAESLSKHKGGDHKDDGLELYGLTSLSDAAAESFGKHKSGIYLNGIIHLSEVAAKHLAKHKNTISLYGLAELSNEAALAFANKSTLNTNDSIQTQITKALKVLTVASAALNPSQRRKIKKLITVEHLSNACELLKAANAEEGDWLAVFTKTRIKTLVDSWDADTWNTLVKELKSFPKMHELLKAALRKRTNYRGSDPAVYARYSNNLWPILRQSSKELKSLIKEVLKDNRYLP
jgi:hypothetical protein